MPQTQKLVPCEIDVYFGILPSVRGCSCFEEELLLFAFHLFGEALTRHQGERGTTWGTLRGSDMFRPQLSIYKMGWPSPSTGGALFSFLTGWEVGRAVHAPGARI